MARKHTMKSKEEKVTVAKRKLEGESARAPGREIGASDRQIRNWAKVYLREGEGGLEAKKKPGNPLARYERRKELTYKSICGTRLNCSNGN